MKNLFEIGNQYVKESDWKDLALIKFCLWRNCLGSYCAEHFDKF